MTTFNFTSRISVPTVAISALIRVSPQPSNLEAISLAYIYTLSFYAHKRNISVSLN